VPDLSAFAVTEGAGEVTQGLIPVRDPGREKPEEGIALCLSRGRLPRDAVPPRRDHPPERDGHLKEIARVSSVSGGSITTDVLGLAWKHLDFGIGGIASNLDELVVKPVRKLAGKTIDNPAIIWGPLLPWRTASGMLASYYAEYLFGGRTVQDLSDDSKGEGRGSCSTRRTCRRESSSARSVPARTGASAPTSRTTSSSIPFPFPVERIERAQGVPTRFAALDAATRDDLIDWRYVIADTSLRRWVYPLVSRPLRLPATEG
jgi:hypothetical protein